MAATVALFAVAAAPALAADIPHGDTDGANWSVVWAEGDCWSGCSFSGESEDFTSTLGLSSGGPVVHECDSVRWDYEIESLDGVGIIDEFEVSGGETVGQGCVAGGPREQMICAYNPTGFEDQEATEYWVRDDWNTTNFGVTFGRLDGELSGVNYEFIEAGSLVIEDQALLRAPVGALQSWTIDGTFEFDSPRSFSLSGSGSGCAFPELAA